MRKKMISFLLCCTLIAQSSISVYGEDLLSSGEQTVSEEAIESKELLDDGAAEALVPENASEEETPEKTVTGEAVEFTMEAPAEDIGSEGAEEENTGEEKASSGQCGENVFWTLDENGVLTIRADGEGYMYSYEQGKSPFYGNLDIKSVKMANGITNIGAYFFENCKNIEEVTFSENIRIIGQYAFTNCISLKNIVIPDEIENFSEGAFSGCSGLECVVMPEKREDFVTMEDAVFSGCSSLKTINLAGAMEGADGAGIHDLSGRVFNGCKSLTDITLPESVRGIFEYAFAECISLENITIFPTVDYISDTAFISANHITIHGVKDSYAEEYAKKNNIPFQPFGSDEEIIKSGKYGENLDWTLDKNGKLVLSGKGDMVDYHWGTSDDPFAEIREKIVSVEVLEGVTSIDFSWCTNLIEINIPDTVKRVDSFYQCEKLRKITLPDTVTMIRNAAFSDCDMLSSINLPKGITHIEADTFRGCWALDNVVIPEGVTGIGESAFSECSSLKNITIPSSVKSIGRNAFSMCYELKNITIPNGIKTIEEGAFRSCYISNIVIPESVTSIGDRAFYSCGYLKEITIPDSVTEISDTAFEGADEVRFLGKKGSYAEEYAKEKNIPFRSVDEDIADSGQCGENLTWTLDKEGLLIIGGIGEMKDWDSFRGPFNRNFKIKKVILKEGVTSIGDNAFDSCENLKEIVISDSVVTIGREAFDNCVNLGNIHIPESVRRIEDLAFHSCTSLKSAVIPDSVTEIGDSAFTGCSNLKNIKLPSELKKINFLAGCSSLEQIEIPDSVTSIGYDAFSNCDSLKNIVIPDGVTSIDDRAFTYCDSLKSVVLSKNITKINKDTFLGCHSLKSITIPDGVTIIEPYAFYDCKELSDIRLSDSVTTIGSFAFSTLGSSLNRVTIPKSVTSIGRQAFSSAKEIHGYAGSEAEQYVKEDRNKNQIFTEHNWQWNTNSATYTQEGEHTKSCTICGLVEESETVPALGHKWGSGVIEVKPSCTTEGKIVYKCERCSTTRTETLPVVAHEYEKVTEKASFGKEGSISEKCKTCGEEKEKTVIPAVSSIQLSETEFRYNGTNRQPKVTVVDSKGNAVSFSASYPAESKKPATYSVTVTLTGENYGGSASASYVITKGKQILEFNDVSKRIDSKTATLKAVIVQGNKTAKIKYSSDNPQVATISANGKVMLHRVGTARITAMVKESENYEGVSKTIALTVLPVPTAVTKLQSQKPGWLNIQYRANSEADGYQMQYGTSVDMKGAKYAAVNTPKIRSYTRKDVISGETYYVRVRTFNVVDGKRVYSNWSGIKNVSVK